mgnify:CR=1 FL=1
MSKRLSAKTGEYQDKQTNETKGEYTQIGVILQNENGEYLLLDPTVNLAGVLAKQNVLALNQNKPQRDNVMCGIYEEQPKPNAPQAQSGFAPQGQQHNNNQNHQQNGFNNNGGFQNK